MKEENNNKYWIIFCEPCGHKEIVKLEDLESRLIEKTKVPGGSPKLDSTTKKTVVKGGVERSGMVKCTGCGRGVVLKNLPEVYAKAIKLVEEEKIKINEEKAKVQRIEDGSPLKIKRRELPGNEGFLG